MNQTRKFSYIRINCELKDRKNRDRLDRFTRAFRNKFDVMDNFENQDLLATIDYFHKARRINDKSQLEKGLVAASENIDRYIHAQLLEDNKFVVHISSKVESTDYKDFEVVANEYLKTIANVLRKKCGGYNEIDCSFYISGKDVVRLKYKRVRMRVKETLLLKNLLPIISTTFISTLFYIFNLRKSSQGMNGESLYDCLDPINDRIGEIGMNSLIILLLSFAVNIIFVAGRLRWVEPMKFEIEEIK